MQQHASLRLRLRLASWLLVLPWPWPCPARLVDILEAPKHRHKHRDSGQWTVDSMQCMQTRRRCTTQGFPLPIIAEEFSSMLQTLTACVSACLRVCASCLG